MEPLLVINSSGWSFSSCDRLHTTVLSFAILIPKILILFLPSRPKPPEFFSINAERHFPRHFQTI